MSQENVEIVRRALDAFVNQRDLDATLRYYDSEIEVDWSRSPGVEAGIHQGHEAVRRFLKTFLDAFDQIAVCADDFIAHGEHVVVPHHAHFSGRDGIRVHARGVFVHTFRDGRILTLRLYRETGVALKAVGLREQA